MNRIIILDIDGVLISGRAALLDYNLGGSGTFKCFDPVAVALLNHALEFTYAKLVIASSWRHTFSRNQFIDIFKINGLNPTILEGDQWKTPVAETRGEEIKKWLKLNCGQYSYFCYVDDAFVEPDIVEEYVGYVKVDYNAGLSLENFFEIMKFLGHSKQETNQLLVEKRKTLLSKVHEINRMVRS
jgi:hypothetical protein